MKSTTLTLADNESAFVVTPHGNVIVYVVNNLIAIDVVSEQIDRATADLTLTVNDHEIVSL